MLRIYSNVQDSLATISILTFIFLLLIISYFIMLSSGTQFNRRAS